MIYNLVMASNSEFAVIIRSNYGLNWQEYIEENIDTLLERLDCEKFQKIVLVFPNLSKKCQDKINEYLLWQKHKYIEYLLFGKLKEYKIKDDYESLLEIIVNLVEEVLTHEEKTYFDIKKRISGHYSDVIEIGTKIIKLGRDRRTYMIPYDKRILTPLVRFDFSKISDLNVILEVSEKVDCDFKITDDMVYSLFKEMRDRGIVCTDMRDENIGALISKNTIHWKKNICDDYINKGITDAYPDEELDVGSLVVLDLDYIYKEDSKYITWAHSPTRDLEFKYQSESLKGKKGIYKVKKIGKKK